MRTSFDLQDGKATQKRMALSCLKNAASMLGFDLDSSDNNGKRSASDLNLDDGVGRIGTCRGERL